MPSVSGIAPIAILVPTSDRTSAMKRLIILDNFTEQKMD